MLVITSDKMVEKPGKAQIPERTKEGERAFWDKLFRGEKPTPEEFAVHYQGKKPTATLTPEDKKRWEAIWRAVDETEKEKPK